MRRENKARNILFALVCNIALAYTILIVCRLIFIVVNRELYVDTLQNNDLWSMTKGALLFDTSAVCYLNILYIVCLLFPLHNKEGKAMQAVTKWSFIIPNTIGVVANLCDCVYVPYTGRRTTWSVFSEFSNEGNLATVIGTEIINNWWLVIMGVAMIWLIYRLYTPAIKDRKNLKSYYLWHVSLLLVSAPLLIFGIRGGIGREIRPITLSNANQYVSSPNEAAIVLNTPFTIIRTAGKEPFTEKLYFEEEELVSIYDPRQQFATDSSTSRKNVVILIVESFGKEYIGAYNPRSEGSPTPFLDSLIKRSKSYRYSYGNGKKSIDGMPSVLSSIPMFVEPFFVADASLNNVSGIAGELIKTGYNSAFFHGAPNGSMGFQAFAKATGFQEYYGMDEYCASPDHNGKDDFDGTWAIWDEPFLQYYAECMDNMEEPFVTSVFTASSHHPFRIPDEFSSVFRDSEEPFLKCAQYTDHALSRFFEYAEKQTWYKNTLFVITADHTNRNNSEEYKTASGMFEVPIIFFLPGGEEPFTPGIDDTLIAQQIDIMPTVLEFVGYDKEFIAFGKSLISATPNESYAVNYTNGVYQYYEGEYLLQFDGDKDKSTAMYNIRNDRLMKENILGTTDVQDKMEQKLKAIIQQYMSRMVHDRLTPETDDNKNR